MPPGPLLALLPQPAASNATIVAPSSVSAIIKNRNRVFMHPSLP